MEKGKNKKIDALDIDSISKRGDLRDTLDLLLDEIKNGSFDTDLYFTAANMALHLGDLDKSQQLVGRLLVLDPEHVKAWLLFGDIVNRKNEIVSEINSEKIAVDISSENPKPERKSVFFADLNDKTVKNMNYRNPKESLNFDTITYADICARQGYYNKALKIYQDHLRKDPGNEELRKKIADIEKRLKDD